jgi:hypothetical protein
MATDLVNLRKRVSDAVRLGVVDDANKEIYEATLIQILNESERQRIRCSNLVEEFKRKAAQAEAQASAYSQVSSIIYNVINGYVLLAEKSQREEEEQGEAEDRQLNAKHAANVKSQPNESQSEIPASQSQSQTQPKKASHETLDKKPVRKSTRRKRR